MPNTFKASGKVDVQGKTHVTREAGTLSQALRLGKAKRMNVPKPDVGGFGYIHPAKKKSKDTE